MDQSVQQGLIVTQKLLQIERDADLEQHQKRIKETSYKYRRLKGVCWYPVLLERTKYDHGDRLIVSVSRSREHVQSDAFQSGKLVHLFCAAESSGDEIRQVEGIVNQVKDQEMLLTLMCDQIPLWVHDGMLGVQLLFDENAYKEMAYALGQVISGSDKRLTELAEVIAGTREAHFNNERVSPMSSLNEKQNLALTKVVQARDIGVIHGPPGTGKTTTLIECVREVLTTENQVLVCAPSNSAVDLLVFKLNEIGIPAVRIGNPARVTDLALSFTLDLKVTQHKDYKTWRQLKKKAEEYFVLSGKWKRNFGQQEREQRSLLRAEAKKLKKEANYLAGFMASSIIEKSQVICSTLVGASNVKLKGKRFSTVFIDEAAQGLEPATWIPILKADRVIFAGDHQQLPPTVKSYEAVKKGFSDTLFEKAIKRNSAEVMLNEQYRMHEHIMSFSSKQFYGGKLLSNVKVVNWKVFSDDFPLEFIDTAGTGFEESIDPDSRSTFNREEANLLSKHLAHYLDLLDDLQKRDLTVGVITPYRAQVNELSASLSDAALMSGVVKELKVNTVDSFQGQERDVIYMSLVRSNDKGEIGFLADKRRMNVAMTRAKKKLVIIGDSATVCRNDFFACLFDYVNEIGAYRSAFEFLYE